MLARLMRRGAVLLLVSPVLAAPAPPRALPPLPDSLRSAARHATAPPARLVLYLRAAHAFATVPDEASATAYAQAAQVLARPLADSVAVGRALGVRAFALLQQGNDAGAAPLLRRAAPLLTAAATPLRWQADQHAWLGWLLGDTNQPAAALAHLRQARAAYGHLRDAAAQAELSGTATVVYLYQGRPDSAALVLMQAARVQHRLALAAEEAATLGNLAAVLQQMGRLPEAEQYARQALATLQRLGDEPSQAAIYQTLGNVVWARHQPTRAAGYYQAAIRLNRRLGTPGNLIATYGSLAGTFTDRQQPDSAVAYYLQAVRLGRQMGQTTGLAVEMGALAAGYAALRRWPKAERWARASLAAGPQQLQLDRPLHVLEQAAEARGDYHAALAWARRQRQYAERQAATQSQQLVQQARARFDTERAEQQVALLTARGRVQRQEQELTRLRTQRTVAALGALTLLTLLLAAVAVGSYRRRQSRREAALRQRLAADLHDDVGNLLTQVSMQADLLREIAAAGSAQLPARLQRLSNTSRQAARQMADVVWNLHASALTLPELLPRLRDHAHEVLLPADLAVDFATTPEAAALRPGPAVCQQLYLIYKEALHNAVKHARGATQVTVRLTREAGCLCLRVRDDGAPPPDLEALPRPGTSTGSGLGLRNMRQRAEAVGGTLRLEPGPAGFGVVACLPVQG